MSSVVARALCALALAACCACVTPAASWGAPTTWPEAPAGEAFVRVRDTVLRVRDEPAKATAAPSAASSPVPVVFIHGYGSRLEGWKLVQPVIAQTRRAVSFDQRGFGLSERPAGAYGPEVHAADVVALLDALHIERAILVGHSYGGGIALRVALRHPERVAGIVLVDAFALDEQVPTSFRWAQVPGVGEALFGGFFAEVPGEKYLLAFHDDQRFATLRALEEVKALMGKPGSTYAALATVRGMDYRSVQDGYAAAVSSLPRAVVWGHDDKVTKRAVGERMASLLQAPLYVAPQCGHMPSWEAPHVVLQAIEAVARDADAHASASTRSNVATDVATDGAGGPP